MTLIADIVKQIFINTMYPYTAKPVGQRWRKLKGLTKWPLPGNITQWIMHSCSTNWFV